MKPFFLIIFFVTSSAAFTLSPFFSEALEDGKHRDAVKNEKVTLMERAEKAFTQAKALANEMQWAFIFAMQDVADVKSLLKPDSENKDEAEAEIEAGGTEEITKASLVEAEKFFIEAKALADKARHSHANAVRAMKQMERLLKAAVENAEETHAAAQLADINFANALIAAERAAVITNRLDIKEELNAIVSELKRKHART